MSLPEVGIWTQTRLAWACWLMLFALPKTNYGSDREFGGAWMEKNPKWSVGLVNPSLQCAQTSILFFGRHNDVTFIECTILRQPNKMTVSPGDPRGVYRGEWKASTRGRMSVTYRLVEATILPTGMKLPGPIQHGLIEILPDGFVEFDNRVFERTSALDHSAHEAVYGITSGRLSREHR